MQVPQPGWDQGLFHASHPRLVPGAPCAGDHLGANRLGRAAQQETGLASALQLRTVPAAQRDRASSQAGEALAADRRPKWRAGS